MRGHALPPRLVAFAIVTLALAGCHDEPTAPRDLARVRAAETVPTYALQDLGTPGTLNGEVYAINDSGIAVGRVWGPGQWSVRWMPDGRIDSLPLYPVVGIADDGTVGGNLPSTCGPAVWHPATGVTPLVVDPADPTQCAQAIGMSRSGVLIAYTLPYSSTSSRHYLFARDASGAWRRQVLDSPPGLGMMYVHDAHATRGAVGRMGWYAFHWTPEDGFTVYGRDLAVETDAYSINGAGVVVGARATGAPAYTYVPVRFVNGATEPLGPGTGVAGSVNERGDILVSDLHVPRIVRADGEVIPLQVPDGLVGSAVDMNDVGIVVGSTRTAQYLYRPVRWGPAPPPPPADSFRVNAGTTYTGVEARTIGFAGTVTGGTSPFTYRWDYGDGAGTALPQGSHAYANDGSYVVTFVVTDAAGRVARDTATALVTNAAPTLFVRSVSPTSVTSGRSVMVEARYDDPGIHDAPWTLQLEARGRPVTPGGPPSAYYSGSASASSAPPASIAASMTLYRADAYDLVVSLCDRDGGCTTAPAYSVSVFRLAVPMTAASTGTELLTTTLSATTGAPLTDVALASVRLGDGVVDGVPVATGADGQPIVARPDVNGDGLADLVLAFRWADLEASGALSTPARGLVLHGDLADRRQFEGRAPVPPRPPVVTLGGPFLATEGASVAVAATASGGTAPLTFRWTFGDGAEATALAATHAWLDDGTYPVTFTATDALGLSATGTTTATIMNAAPVLTLGAGATVYSGDAFTVRGRVDDAGAGDAPWRWTVAWPAPLSPTSGALAAVPGDIVATEVLRRAGTALVSVRVTDADGASAEGVVSVTVRRLPLPMSVSPASMKAAERGDGLVTVTLRPTERVAVRDIDVASVRLDGAPVESRGNGALHAQLQGSELVLKFRRDALRTGGALRDVLVLQADLRDGRQVEARWAWVPA